MSSLGNTALWNSSNPYVEEVEGYLLCVYSFEGENPDMQGFAVRLSNFIVNICLVILIRYSEENIAESLSVLLLQIYTLLVCAFISMIQKQLSIADAHFAVTSTVSPLSLYLVYASVRKLIKKSSYLFSRLGQNSTKYLVMSLLMVPIWFTIELLIYFADVFSDVPRCPHITLVSWIMFSLMSVFTTFVFAAMVAVVLISIWVVYLLRHFRDILGEYRRLKMKAPRWKRFRWVQWLPLWFNSLMSAQWNVLTLSHPWLASFTILVTYIAWGSALNLYTVDMSYFYYQLIVSIQEENGVAPDDIKPYAAPSGYQPLGYGQLLAGAVAFPPLWDVLCLIWAGRHEILAWIKRYPTTFWNAVIFLLTGHRNPWKKVLAGRTGDSESTYDSVPLTGPGEELKVDQDSIYENNDKVEPSLDAAWRSTTSLDYSSVYVPPTTLYDPYQR
ncbi:hypothetical protein BDP27DRAFT_641154 [Rhodocollybia butyracea]|uniref:Uncharacterized protein n=1 Tax=Rhodocollybia butyracea TaxID=206335 RepID=A0A9P5P4C2_9AGAR|nr:hypothetical protein BDP27DRAFT_641154 [Rhodocollybia butyracea]